MKRIATGFLLSALISLLAPVILSEVRRMPNGVEGPLPSSVRQPSTTGRSYLGFDRNDYPGDANLLTLHRTFAFTGYWLNNPPGGNANTWKGKRQKLQDAGFGFLVLFNGRTYAEIQSAGDATRLGSSDAHAAITAARTEGFPSRTIIFLDQEQGGRLLPEQRAYLHAWIDAVTAAGFEAGVYCSGIAAKESGGVAVITAEDIRKNAAGLDIHYWVVNDSCPPSPGCTAPGKNLPLAASGIDFAEAWQFAQSPKRRDFARACPGYNRDGNCYPPALELHIDLNVATTDDPSHARTKR